MDLYQVSYRKKDYTRNPERGFIDLEGPVYNLIVRCEDIDYLEKVGRPWLLSIGVNIDDLFLVKAINLNKTCLTKVPMYSGRVSNDTEDVLFV